MRQMTEENSSRISELRESEGRLKGLEDELQSRLKTEMREMSLRLTEIEQQSISSYQDLLDLKEGSKRTDAEELEARMNLLRTELLGCVASVQEEISQKADAHTIKEGQIELAENMAEVGYNSDKHLFSFIEGEIAKIAE